MTALGPGNHLPERREIKEDINSQSTINPSIINPIEKEYDSGEKQEKLKEIAKKNFSCQEESLGTRLHDSAKRGWKVLTTTISEFFQLIFSLFTSAVTNRSQVQSNAEHVSRSVGEGIADDLAKDDLSEEGESEAGELSENESYVDDFFSDDLSVNAAVQASQEGGEDVSVIGTLFHPIETLKQSVDEFKLENFDDVRKGIDLLNTVKQHKDVLLDITDTIDFSSKSEKEEVTVLTEMLNITEATILGRIVENQQMLQDLLQTAESVEDIFACAELMWRCSIKGEEQIEKIILTKLSINASEANVQMTAPVGLVNRSRNACYRNAVNQMLAVPFFQNLVVKRYANAKDAEDGIGKTLLNLWTYQKSENPKPSRLWAYDEHLLKALCAPGVIPGGSPEEDLYLAKVPGLSIDNKYQQQDASAYLEALFEEFDHKLTVTSTLDGMDGITTSNNRVVESALLQLSRLDTIEDSFRDFLHEKISDPKNPWKSESGKSFNTYLKHFKIETAEPLEVITVNVKRKMVEPSGAYKIDSSPMAIPKNNIVDLSNAYDLPLGSALYELQGFVWNWSGHLTDSGESGGHFIAYVNREGVWYECDDEKVTKIDPNIDPKKAGEFETRKSQFVLGSFIKTPKKSLTNS